MPIPGPGITATFGAAEVRECEGAMRGAAATAAAADLSR
jgi:hypothetical protein